MNYGRDICEYMCMRVVFSLARVGSVKTQKNICDGVFSFRCGSMSKNNPRHDAATPSHVTAHKPHPSTLCDSVNKTRGV